VDLSGDVTGKHPLRWTDPARIKRHHPSEAMEVHFRRLIQLTVASEEKILVAVSGGMDSVALLHLLVACLERPRDRIVAAHFDHGLRRESIEEAVFVVQRCQHLEIPWVQERWSTPHGPGNLQERAREARYRFFSAAAVEHGCRWVATGHHGDDQGETFLEHLLRGSGLKGLSAIPFIRPLQPGIDLLRPMLFFFREEIHQWMRSQGLEWREDPSNHSDRYVRSRLRHEVVPVLATLAPQVRRQLLATSMRMARAEEALSWTLDHFWSTLEVETFGSGLSLARSALVALPDELIVRVLARCSKELRGGSSHPLGSRALDGFLHMVHSPVRHWRMEVRGLEISRDDTKIFLCIAMKAPRRKTNKK